VQEDKEVGLKWQGGRAKGERKEEIIGKEGERVKKREGSARGQGGRAKGTRRKDCGGKEGINNLEVGRAKKVRMKDEGLRGKGQNK
jgi:hypothetical protein